MEPIKLISNLAKTWIFDLDGTITKHNGHINNDEKILEGVEELFKTIPPDHLIIILTARQSIYRRKTKHFLDKYNLRYDHLIMDVPKGERILINDEKPDGTPTAFSINVKRNAGPTFTFELDQIQTS